MRSGNYEVDDEGNLVEVGEGDKGATGETPAPVRRAMRVYTLAQAIGIGILLVMIVTMPDIRGLLVVFTTVWVVIAFFLHRFYRWALMRSYANRSGHGQT